MNKSFGKQKTKGKLSMMESRSNSKPKEEHNPRLAYDSVKSLQKMRTRLILEESNNVFLNVNVQKDGEENKAETINNLVDEIYDNSKQAINKDILTIVKLLESKRYKPEDMFLQSKLLLRLNEREEKVMETIKNI